MGRDTDAVEWQQRPPAACARPSRALPVPPPTPTKLGQSRETGLEPAHPPRTPCTPRLPEDRNSKAVS